MKTIQDYLDLITSSWNKKPKFMAMISAVTAPFVQIQSLLAAMAGALFDLDTPPAGDQLDIIGKWAGVSRKIPVPVDGADIFFSWDDTSGGALGWDFGTWAPAGAVQLAILPDDAYLTLIKAKIAANQWDGTTEGAYAIWANLFTQYFILIIDNQDMTFDLAVIGSAVDSLTIAIITQGLIPLRPEGVKISDYLFSVDSNPAFAWDLETTELDGWDLGSWLKEVAPT